MGSRYAKVSVADAAAVQNILSYTEHPFGKGDLTATGVQYSAVVAAATGTTNYVVESITINPGCAGDALEYEFGLTATFKSTTNTLATIGYQWQARNNGGTWVGLHATQVISATVGNYTAEPTWSGRFTATANLNRVPFDVKLVYACSYDADGFAKTKNSSYVSVLYKAD